MGRTHICVHTCMLCLSTKCCTLRDLQLTFLGSGTGSLVQTLATLIAASHAGQVDSSTEHTLPPAKRVHSKVLVADTALLAPFEDLCSTEWTRLLLCPTAQRRRGKNIPENEQLVARTGGMYSVWILLLCTGSCPYNFQNDLKQASLSKCFLLTRADM